MKTSNGICFLKPLNVSSNIENGLDKLPNLG